jgi:hypothetical protein
MVSGVTPRRGPLSVRPTETMSDAYLNVPTQLAILSRDEINAASITRVRFMRAQLKVPCAEDEKLVEYAHIYQDINVASRYAKVPKFKLETIFTATSRRGWGVLPFPYNEEGLMHFYVLLFSSAF